MNVVELAFRHLAKVVPFSAAPGRANTQEMMSTARAAVIPPCLWFPCHTQRCTHPQKTLCREIPTPLTLTTLSLFLTQKGEG